MTLTMQHIIKHLFRVDSLEQVPLTQLEDLVKEHPSFGMGRYLLSRKLHAENAGHFTEETQKTNLYFNNPLWLQWLLMQSPSDRAASPSIPATHSYTEPAPVHEPEPVAAAPTWEPVVEKHDEPGEEAHAYANTVAAEPVAETYSEPNAETHTYTEPTAEVPIDTATDAWEPGHSTHSAADLLLQSIAELQGHRQALAQQEEARAEAEQPSSIALVATALEQTEEIPTLPATQEETPVAEPEATEVIDTASGTADIIHETPIHDEEAAFVLEEARVEEGSPLEEPAVTPEEDFIKDTPVEKEPPAALAFAPEPAAAAAAEEAFAPMPSIVEEAAATPEVTASAPPPPVTVAPVPATEAPIFEPYHTVDYFASQGIKLTLDDNPSDRLGKQMKSFTDWLKTMRKLPQKNREIIPDIAAEHQVQAIAAHSIEGKEIVTETMADVLAKQGMRERAVEMYRKLSLLEPDKSAYFATKIEQLKIN